MTSPMPLCPLTIAVAEAIYAELPAIRWPDEMKIVALRQAVAALVVVRRAVGLPTEPINPSTEGWL